MPESDQHRKRARSVTSEPSVNLAARDDGRRELTHVTWDDTRVDVSSIRPSDVDRALARFRSQLPELVWNAAALEGNTYTLPEVRALLEEVSVAGKPLDDERQILALSEAYGHLDQLLADRAFRLTRARRTPYTPSWPAMRPWTRAGSVAKGPRPVVVMCACLTGPWSRAPTRVRAAPSTTDPSDRRT